MRLELLGITKRFGRTLANDRVDLAVAEGEIHALLGENGAGKSTLVKIIYGLVRPDAGHILWEGKPVEIASPVAARALGIGMVFQHFSLFDTLTVTENVALGTGWRGDLKALALRIREVAERYGLAIDPARHVHDLSTGERQRVEIVRALLEGPRLLIMDEPTSVLTPQEAAALFAVLRRLAAEGCSILLISHKLEEIRALASRATVLRQGRVVGVCDPRAETPASLAQMMIGEAPEPRARRRGEAGAERLRVEHLTLPSSERFGTALRDVTFVVRAGEIVGVAGVAGNGQKELLAALSGEALSPAATAIRLSGEPIGRVGPAERRRLGLAVIPEERLGRGAVAEMSLAENALLTHGHGPMVRRGLIRFAEVARQAQRIFRRFSVTASGVAAEAKSLSGGNLQKFIVGRELSLEPQVLVAAHPTWGVDVGAAAVIHHALFDLRDAGAGILVISEDLGELFEISDRLAVLTRGRLSPLKPTEEATVEEVGLLMAGARELEAVS